MNMWFSDHETDLAGIYKSCELCPRACRVDRTRGVPGKGPGFCGETDQLRVAHVGPHFGEEPPFSGSRGSGTVFFSGCSLKCKFCQNHQISLGGMGETLDFHGLVEEIRRMILEKGGPQSEFCYTGSFHSAYRTGGLPFKKRTPSPSFLLTNWRNA